MLSFLFVFAGPAECCGLENFGSPWRAVAADVQTFQKKEIEEKIHDVKWMLTIILVAPECRDITGLARLCHCTFGR
jgi:hypothetical protein